MKKLEKLSSREDYIKWHNNINSQKGSKKSQLIGFLFLTTEKSIKDYGATWDPKKHKKFAKRAFKALHNSYLLKQVLKEYNNYIVDLEEELILTYN